MRDQIPKELVDDGDCLEASMDFWNVEAEYSQHIVSYLRYGWEPGGFFTAVLANDCLGALLRSHPLNTMDSLKQLALWIENRCPMEAFGSYDKVAAWCKLTNEQRRTILEREGIVKTPWQMLLAQA